MADPVDPKDEAIARLQAEMAVAIRMIGDLSVRVETLRGLLYRHAVISDAEYEEMYAARRKQWDDFCREQEPKLVEASHAEELRRLLERFEGKPQ